MSSPSLALAAIPSCLRDPLLEEYRRIVQHFLERKWQPSELAGGRFCEIVYTILVGYASGTYAAAPSKPSNFVDACRKLENNANVPRSFQILIPRMLPPLYEIRNNRGVGHVGGDVDSNQMDATAVLGMVNWVMAELVRVYHQLPIPDAQEIVDQLAVRKIPVVWELGKIKRVLNPKISMRDQMMLLIGACPASCSCEELFNWTDNPNRGYLKKTLRELHKRRFVEISADETTVQILPPGSSHVEKLIQST